MRREQCGGRSAGEGGSEEECVHRLGVSQVVARDAPHVTRDMHERAREHARLADQDRARAAFEIFNKIYATGKGFKDLTWEIISKDGQKRIIELSANLIIDKEGKKVGFRGIARDVTERFKAQEELKQSELRYQCAYEASRIAEQQYKTLLDFIPYPMVVFTLDGKVSYLNPAFTDTFGWTLPELQGKYIPYVPPELQEQTQESIRKLFEDKVIPRQVSRRLTKDGRILDVMMSGANRDERFDLASDRREAVFQRRDAFG